MIDLRKVNLAAVFKADEIERLMNTPAPELEFYGLCRISWWRQIWTFLLLEETE